MSTLLELDKLVVGYHGRPLLPPLSLTVHGGEQWALVGPNGAGKTTLLKTILCLLPKISGDVTTHGNVGYVPQRASLNRSVPGRVADIVRSSIDTGWSFLRPAYRSRSAAAVRTAMRDAHVEELSDQQYSSLSEGQKQRVLVARALAAEPHLLILDEPTAAMDAEAERAVFGLLDELRAERALAVLIVSHHLHVAAQHATHAIVVDKDRDHAVAGRLDEIVSDPKTLERYGELFAMASQHG